MGRPYTSLNDFLKRGRQTLARGPVAILFVEDEVEIGSTLHHLLARGFDPVLALAPPDLDFPPDLDDKVQRIDCDTGATDVVPDTVNRLIAAAPGTWFHYCFNAEYLFHPFSETRSVGEMLTFHAEERRDAMITFVIDLYAADLTAHPTGVARDAWLDSTGYYALARNDPETGWPRERQLDFFGGLRRRYEEHVPELRRRIDRVSLFRARPGLELRGDHSFNDPEYNTYACPWHHNLTAAVCSFRAAKALKRNPHSSEAIDSFRWRASVPFDWQSRQLLDLGLMEPGQWF